MTHGRTKNRQIRKIEWGAACVLWAASALLTTSGAQSPNARLFYARGLAALHVFEYEDANDAFAEAQRIDPGFAMAYWGEAMTYNQTLWRKEDIAAGRRALARLAPTPVARAAKAETAAEKGLMAAVDMLFGDGDSATRRRHYADAMGRLHAADPQDPDVAALYALALLGTMSRGLIGHEDAHEGRTQGLAGSDVQARVGEILNGVLKTHPQHAGALHYLLHNYDDPDHARLGLTAARALTRLAPDSSHARHMPAHIFLQLGMWREAALCDRTAFDAATAWVARRHFGPEVRNYHALAWLQYELLQRGRYHDAQAAMGELEPLVKATGNVTLMSDLSSMRARFVVETRRWAVLAREEKFSNVHDLFAIGLSAARTRQLNTAD